MEKLVDVMKGTRVRVEYFKANEDAALAGGQMKLEAELHQFEGTLRHIRGDHPTHPRRIGFWVQPDSDAEKYGAEMCEKCGVLEVGPLYKEHLTPLLDDEAEENP
jgi:hypothetical protein